VPGLTLVAGTVGVESRSRSPGLIPTWWRPPDRAGPSVVLFGIKGLAGRHPHAGRLIPHVSRGHVELRDYRDVRRFRAAHHAATQAVQVDPCGLATRQALSRGVKFADRHP